MNLVQTILKNKKIIALLVVVLAIPLTVFIAQKQQEIRQRAAGEQTSLYFMPGTDCNALTTQTTSVSLNIGQQYTYSLCLDGGSNNISGFDITMSFGNAFSLATISDMSEGRDAARFNNEFLKTLDRQTGIGRFAKGNTNTSQVIQGKLQLAQMSFTPTQVGSGTVAVSNATISSITSETALTVSKPTVSYTIGQGRTISPTPTGIQAPLSASITGPTTGNTGESLRYNATASGQNLRGIEIFRAKVGSDITRREAWTNIGSNLSCNNQATCTTSGSFTPSENGQYYVAVNAYELNNARVCSGNPAVKDGRVTGWAVCGPNDLITLTVDAATPTLTPTPTSGVTPTPTPPGATPTPTATPVPGAVQFTFTLNLPGIGDPGNNNPKTNPRTIEVELFDSDNDPLPLKTGTVSFNNTANLFRGTVDVGTLAPGSYTMKLKTARYLKKPIPGIIKITSSRTTPYVIPSVTLTVGNTNNDSKINILDFNMWRDCYQGKLAEASCITSVDFNDDGIVRGTQGLTDGNLLIGNMGAREGD